MDELISVIVPIYKVEKYLPQCIHTICNQTYRNLEIILVDDGSPDSCGQLCDEYAGQDNRIRVVHKKNGGLSDARNAGLQVATGKYVMFIDSDDYLHLQMIEILYKNLIENDADLSICGLKLIPENEKGDFQCRMKEIETIVIENNEERLQYFFGNTQVIFTVAWNKLYKREHFKDIRYPKGKLHEDEFTTYKILDLSKKIVYTPVELYFYVQRQDSIMGIGFNVKRLSRLEAFQERMELYLSQGRLDFYAQVLFFYRIFLLQYEDVIQSSENIDPEILVPYKKIYRNQVKRNLKKCRISLKEKASHYMYSYFPGLYYIQYRKKQETGAYKR